MCPPSSPPPERGVVSPTRQRGEPPAGGGLPSLARRANRRTLIMEGSLAAVTAIVAACSACMYQAGDTSLSSDVHIAELKGHVYHLASPELMGRRGPGGARAARYVADAFGRLGLEPAFGGSYFQDIPSLLHEGTRQ